eukprot:s4696_g5.t1
MYLTRHYRPPHGKDPGGLKYEQKQQGAKVGSSQEEGTSTASASASASASGGSPQGEVPARGSDVKTKAMPRKKPRTDAQAAADASKSSGSSPHGEVPTLDAASLHQLIRENELLEEKTRRAEATTSEGSKSYAYQSGDTVHGKLDASKIRQQEELNEILRRARTNPWHLFKPGLLRRVDASGNRMETTYGDPLEECSW